MLFAPNPGILASGSSAPRTYEEWLSHITARATGGAISWTGLVNIDPGLFTTQSAAPGPSYMNGSPWLSKFAGGGAVTRGCARVVQHGLPSQAVFDAQIASARVLFLSISAATASPPVALNRNGYLSIGDEFSNTANRLCTEVSYWHDGAPWTTNPNAGSGPIPYAAAGW